MLRWLTIVVASCLPLALWAPPAQAAKGDPEPIVVKDPHYGEVLFYFYQEDYFPAIVRLLAAEKQQQLTEEEQLQRNIRHFLRYDTAMAKIQTTSSSRSSMKECLEQTLKESSKPRGTIVVGRARSSNTQLLPEPTSTKHTQKLERQKLQIHLRFIGHAQQVW